jgi:hypothetical protein
MTDPTESMDHGRLLVCRGAAPLLRRHGLVTFESFHDERTGRLLRNVGPRANARLMLEDEDAERVFFLKRHEPPKFTDRLACWVRLQGWRSPGRVEWENIHALARLGIASMKGVVLGEDPATGRSFLMTAKIPEAYPADDYADAHFVEDIAARRMFARRLGELVRTLHGAGLTHRDLYLCHVFVRETPNDFALHLIDLQRLGPHWLLTRWRVKDLAQLAYSRDEDVLTRTDCVRFLHAYFGVRRLDASQTSFVRRVTGKTYRMRRRLLAREATT